MAKTINLRDVDDVLVKAAKRRALDEDTTLKGYIVGLMQKDLKVSRSASTREDGSGVVAGMAPPTCLPTASTQSGTESNSLTRKRKSEPVAAKASDRNRQLRESQQD